MTVSSSSFIPTPLAQAFNQGEGHPSGMPLYVSQFESEVFEQRTAVHETTGKTPAELFLGSKPIPSFQKLVMVLDGVELAVGNIEKIFKETRQNTRVKHEKLAKYYNKRRRDVSIWVNDWELVETHPQGRASPYNLRPRNKVTNLDLQEEQCKPKGDQSGPEENHFGGQAFTTNVNTRNKVVNSRSKVKGTEDPVIIFLDKVDTPDKELGTVIEDDDDTNIDSEKDFSLEQKLELAMTKKISTNQNSIQKPAISKAFQQEIDLFDEEEFRGKYLEKHELCDMLRRLVGTTAPGDHDCSIQE
ncbi:hypothetical protein TNCV_1488671 [Trichonephila clavipes]|nr:hypothetical protein TNCV_1488671 [Trichonephila clavipes]